MLSDVVVKLIGGIVCAVACSVIARSLGSGFGLNSVVKLLGGRGAFVLVSSGWWHRVGSCCL